MKYISSDPHILGGTPVIKGTRVPVERILFLLKEGYPLESIHEDYPHISVEVLAKAIDEVTETINTTLNAKKVL